MEGFGHLPWLSEMLRKFACFHSRGAVGTGSSRAAKGRRRGNLILLGGKRSAHYAVRVSIVLLLLLPAAESSQKCPRHHLFGKAAFPAFRSPFPVIYPHSVPSSTTVSSSHHVPPRPLRISGSPLAPFRCNHSVPHHCCVSSFLGIQPPGRRMSVSVHASMTCLFGH